MMMLATSSLTGVPRKTMRSLSSLLKMSQPRSPRCVCSMTVGMMKLCGASVLSERMLPPYPLDRFPSGAARVEPSSSDFEVCSRPREASVTLDTHDRVRAILALEEDVWPVIRAPGTAARVDRRDELLDRPGARLVAEPHRGRKGFQDSKQRAIRHDASSLRESDGSGK